MALGLVPLKPEPDHMKDIIHRYQVIKEYIRDSKNYGSKRRDGNGAAGLNGLKNLMYNAGHTDLKKFEIAMEIESVRDLAIGPVSYEFDEYRFILSINQLGEPLFEMKKNGKPVKSIPGKLKDNETVKSLKARLKQIRRQSSRLHKFLEELMCNGDEFSSIEFQGLMVHPILKPMMEQLIFISSTGMGYPIRSAKALLSYDGTEIILDENAPLRIAHSYDLLMTGEWHHWQHECFVNERIQPCKQVFREVYVVTDAEKNGNHEL